ncbi:hypothetical protein [Paenibacillus sp. JCM 10914]|uniref:hypothetical protein n=1 Tax=Paenibacillus sp. JCM 10914 TaxID=1236974 RepID=UPI0003CCAE0E|nr:hypothetical protein [Paenibacillus sp. JCM 10914]GAE08780.1 hypothetical protein JCM10914_5113 [Paenibacillus sp. JCM 10914]
MKITKAESFILHVPITPPITDAINVATHWGVTGVRIETDEALSATAIPVRRLKAMK